MATSPDRQRRIRRHIANLNSPDARTSERAEQYLIRYYGASALNELLEACDSRNPVVRFRAAWALGHTRDPRAFETLLRLTDDPDKGVRYDATLALGMLGDPRALQPLTAYFWSRDESRPGADGLCRLGLVSVPVLEDALRRGDPDLRWTAARVLGWLAEEHQDPRCIELLRGCLEDADREVREEASEWLSRHEESPIASR